MSSTRRRLLGWEGMTTVVAFLGFLLLLTANPIFADESDHTQDVTNKLTSFSGIRSLLVDVIDNAQEQIETGMKALGSKFGEDTPVEALEMQNDHVDQSKPSKKKRSEASILKFSQSPSNKNGIIPKRRKLSGSGSRETQSRDIFRETKPFSSPLTRAPGSECRCEYEGEGFYTTFASVGTGGSKSGSGRRHLGKSKDNDIRPKYRTDKDGILVLPLSHPSCQNIIYICNDETPPEGVNQWKCPSIEIFAQLRGGSKAKGGKGKGNKSKNGVNCPGSKNKGGKGKGNKSKNGSVNGIGCPGVIAPPSWVRLPEDDPRCPSTAPSPAIIDPTPLPTLAVTDCEDPYDAWAKCITNEGCSACGFLSVGSSFIPGEDCDAFIDWRSENFACCTSCSDQFAAFEDCKECEIPQPSPTSLPTRPPTSGAGTAAPTSAPFNDEEPTPAPSLEAPTPSPSKTCDGDMVFIDFETDSEGNDLDGGTCVADQWAEDGLTMRVTGGCGDIPCLLDSASVASGQKVLGSPNRECDAPGPGRGKGGIPGTDGENCIAQKNILIDDCGGILTFDFAPIAKQVYEIGLLNIRQSGTTITVTYDDDQAEILDVPRLGVNSVQAFEISREDVKQIKVNFSDKGAVTYLSYCTDNETSSPIGPGSPQESPSSAPTPEPETARPTTSEDTRTPAPTTTGSVPLPTQEPGTSFPSLVSQTTLPTQEPQTQGPTIELETPFGKLEGVVFQDTNGNGAEDVGEPGISGVDVVITTSEGDVFTLTTDEAGTYIAEVPAGPTVTDVDESTLPLGYEQTAGFDPTTVDIPAGGIGTDSDGYQFPDTSAPTPEPDTSFPTQEPETAPPTTEPKTAAPVTETEPPPTSGGSVPTPAPPTTSSTGKLEGVVFQDTNGNGAEDVGEPGISGVDVVITTSDGDVFTLTTDEIGMYTAEVPAGPTVTDIDENTLPPGYEQTAGVDPTTVDVPAGGFGTDSDGYQFPDTSAPTPEPDTSVPTPEPDTSFPTPEPGTSAPTKGGETPTTPPSVSQPTPGGGTPTPATKFCLTQTITFDTDADGADLPGGEYVQSEWLDFGLLLSCSGKNVLGNTPRLFDTSNPVDGEYGDADLGSPNQACTPSGPGVGSGGIPGAPGENCDPLGNVLICQEDNDNPDIPDDAVGGLITFEFTSNVLEVFEIGMLDSSRGAEIIVETFDGTDTKMDTIPVERLGENANQTVVINRDNVKRLSVYTAKGGAVTFISLCYEPETLPPFLVAPPSATQPPSQAPVIPAPTPGSGIEPTPTPPTQVSPTSTRPTSSECINAEIDFNSLPDGTTLNGGEYLDVQYKPFYGVEFSASGGLGDAPRLFDTAKVGNTTYGDPDLGSPNEKCPGGGPGIGDGGAPGPNGANPYQNCVYLGNVLIIQEDNGYEEQPDDNQDGGVITMDFSPIAEEVYEIGLLDVDYPLSITVVYINDEGEMEEKPPSAVPKRGNNSLQTVVLNEKKVVQLRLNMKRSGATAFMSFCHTPPTPAPTAGAVTLLPTSSPTKKPPTRAPPFPASPTRSPSSKAPTGSPTGSLTVSPTAAPTPAGSDLPTISPTSSPTGSPTGSPNTAPTAAATDVPSKAPTRSPTGSPTVSPTAAPTPAGSDLPTISPTSSPTGSPTGSPNTAPTAAATDVPSKAPTTSPTRSPTASPTATQTGKLQGVIFEDVNGNGVQDDDEPGIVGVAVAIIDSKGELFSLTTDENGEYVSNIRTGLARTNIMESTLPPGSVQTAGFDPTIVDVPAGGTATDSDGFQFPTNAPTAGPVPTAEPETSTPTLEPSTFVPTAEFDTPVPSTTEPTDSQPTTGGLTTSSSPSESPSESTVPPTSSPAESPTGSPTSSPTASPTVTPFGKIEGTVFEDVNANGVQDPGEPGIEGVDVTVADSTGQVFNLTTGETGRYMAEVAAGPIVTFIDESTFPLGYEQTAGDNPTRTSVPESGTVTDLDGYHFPTGGPTRTPTGAPTRSPTGAPTASPTGTPTSTVTGTPTGSPTGSPTESPTQSPTAATTLAPTSRPSKSPTDAQEEAECTESFEDWVTCVDGDGSCDSCDTSPPGRSEYALQPGEDCETFFLWNLVNSFCCDGCAEKLDAFKECKDCEIDFPTASPSQELTLAPTPEQETPAPTPRSRRKVMEENNSPDGKNLRATALER